MRACWLVRGRFAVPPRPPPPAVGRRHDAPSV